ncbi:MAG: hypothetical protein LBD79_04310 [Treponema sp.]|jgi:hypothetical protein|nr:hypothetical protein [Treponema sp.]
MKNRIFTVLFGLVLVLSNPFSIAAQAIVDNAQAQTAPVQTTPATEPPIAQDAPLLKQDAPQPPQSPAQIDSLTALDAEAVRFSALLGQTLAALPPDTRVTVGSFQFDDVDSLFGTYWNKQLSSNLSRLENRRFLIITSNQAETDYTLDGLTLLIGDTLRIYTQLIRVEDAALMDTWVTDFLVTPFIQTLLLPGFASPPVPITPIPSYPSSMIAPDEYEPDSIDYPVFIENGEPWLERTLHEGDEDWFVLIPDEDGILILETAGDIDTYMTLYEAEAGLVLAQDDDSGEYYNAYIEYKVEAGKIYIVAVWSSDYETGVYQFRASTAEAPSDASIEPNNSMEEAALIEVGEQVNGYFELSSDVDWYRINAEPGAYLIIYTNGTMDTVITAYDQAGNELGSDDDLGSGFNARLMLIVPSGGVVYVELTEYDGAQGAYTLKAELMAAGESDAYEPDNNLSFAKRITLGETQNRTFTIAEDADYVRFTISEKNFYEIRTIAAGDYLDSYIGLYHADTDEYIAEDNDSGANYDAYLRVELEAGDYFLEIYCMSDDPLSNNAYTLSLTLVTEDDSD